MSRYSVLPLAKVILVSNSGSPAVPYAPNSGTADPGGGLEHERAYVAMLYAHLDARRADTARRLDGVLHDETVGTPQALTERDAAAAMYTDRLAALRAAEHGLAAPGETAGDVRNDR